MLRVGLTGGIGSGKSTVSAQLTSLGAVVIDADAVAREVVEPGTPALGAIADRFGSEVLTSDGVLDRPALGRLVFGDAAALRDLEAITHPAIWARTSELMAAVPPGRVMVSGSRTRAPPRRCGPRSCACGTSGSSPSTST